MTQWVVRGAGLVVSAILGAFAIGCSGAAGDGSDAAEEKFSSANATLVDFTFDGELTTTSPTTTAIRTQMLYTVGHLNAEPGVARLDKLALTNVTSASLGGGLYQVRYHARLPVAWGHKDAVPATYTLTLPHRVDGTGQSQFLTKYQGSCNDGEGAEINAGNFWFHYRPHARGCSFTSADVMTAKATVAKDAQNTSGKYPEYDKVWADGELRVVAVFGKYTKGATAQDDPGIAAYNGFVNAVRDALGSPETFPAGLPRSPGVSAADVTLKSTRADGRAVMVTAILVDEVQSAPPSFDKRYAELTPGADVILYNGHAGLGANVRALAHKGQFFPGSYQIFFMNGCDTFAYMDTDTTLATTRTPLNPDDPAGTKYMDFVTNAMPAFFSSMPDASMSLLRALFAPAAPQTYEQIFAHVDPSQVVVVTGEEDNAFTPAAPIGTPAYVLDGDVAHAAVQTIATGVLAPGRYAVEMTADPAFPGADADLFARVGAVPDTTSAFKCPSYKWNSNERCVFTVASPAAIEMKVSGYSSADAKYGLRVWPL